MEVEKVAMEVEHGDTETAAVGTPGVKATTMIVKVAAMDGGSSSGGGDSSSGGGDNGGPRG